MDKKYLKQVAVYFLTTVVSLGVMLYIGYHLFYGLTQKVDTEPALISTVSFRLTADAYIFRDEIPLASSGGGSLVPAVSDGERVGIGDVVSRRYDSASPDILARLEEINLQLDVIGEMQQRNLSVRDTASVDSEIYALLAEISRSGASGDADSLLARRASLTAALNRRTLLIGASGDPAAAADALRSEKKQLTAQLGACRAEITTSRSGYYYADCDGYESAFTVDAALSSTPEEFLRLIEAEPGKAAAGGKIATGYTWYAACITRDSTAASFAVGKKYSVSFPYNGGTALQMTLVRLVESEDGTFLVFSCTALPGDFVFTRSQPIAVTAGEYSGIRLPLSALRAVDGVSGVYVLSGGIVRYRAVSVLAEGEDWFLADPDPEADPPAEMQWLSRNDIVITNGRGLYEGRILQ